LNAQYLLLKFNLKVVVEASIVNASRITDQPFKSNLTFCVVCVFTLQTNEWSVHKRLQRINLNEHPILQSVTIWNIRIAKFISLKICYVGSNNNFIVRRLFDNSFWKNKKWSRCAVGDFASCFSSLFNRYKPQIYSVAEDRGPVK
jgi:predicted small integral membrane protein